MTKILSRSGDSLADIYDVKGSIAGIDQLETRELPIMHEMGHTVFSERFGSNIPRGDATALAQNLTWDVTLSGFGRTVVRILSLMVFANVGGRITNAQVSVRSPALGREVPIWYWNSTVDSELTIRMQDDGGALGNFTLLRPVQLFEGIPNILTGVDQRTRVDEVVFRGLTSGFGAGTVQPRVVLHTAFSEEGGLGSRGLPIPGW